MTIARIFHSQHLLRATAGWTKILAARIDIFYAPGTSHRSQVPDLGSELCETHNLFLVRKIAPLAGIGRARFYYVGLHQRLFVARLGWL